VQPFERLRYIARWGDDDGIEMLSEAADCLASFEDDLAGLVVACRRLLAHHPSNGALWWLCSRVLTAADPDHAAWDAWQLLRDDRTATRLAESLPFPHDEPVAVVGWPDTAGAALVDRPDLDVVVVRRRRDDGRVARRLRADAGAIRVVAEPELLALAPSHLLVEAAAAGPQHALVSPGTVELVEAVRQHGTKVWLVVAAGRALPERLLDAMERAVGAADGAPLDRLPHADVDRAAGPLGVDRPIVVARRADCPVAPELLRLGV
jgi:hypothetical protein